MVDNAMQDVQEDGKKILFEHDIVGIVYIIA